MGPNCTSYLKLGSRETAGGCSPGSLKGHASIVTVIKVPHGGALHGMDKQARSSEFPRCPKITLRSLQPQF